MKAFLIILAAAGLLALSFWAGFGVGYEKRLKDSYEEQERRRIPELEESVRSLSASLDKLQKILKGG